jgi:protein-tyrosine kinase
VAVASIGLPSAARRPTAWPPANWAAGPAGEQEQHVGPRHRRVQPAPTPAPAKQGAATLHAHPTADLASLRQVQAAAAATIAKIASIEIQAAQADIERLPPAAEVHIGVPVATPPTVHLNLVQLEELGHLVPHSKRSLLTEQFRHIKRPLLNNARSPLAGANRGSLLMVTSALPREGKTFFAINLALSMAAEIDTAVLLVDADVVRPELMKRLGVNARLGLLDLLTRSDLDLEDVVLHTNVPKLSLLPSGTRNELSSELLGSAAMESLLDDLMKRYPDHIVIFDVPPLLVTNEAQVLASHVGQVVMVVQAANTPVADVRKAFDMLESCGVVMSVLNKTPASAEAKGYGSYYG